jgi:hypothetical protein
MKKIEIKKQSILDSLLVLICGIILCFMGFYNNFPFVFSDCGTYIGSGFSLKVPIDRPIFYGLFIRHVSLLTSLWLVILVQGLIVSLILFYFFKYLSGTSRFRIYYIAFIIFITFFTSASFHVSQLIPDIFTSVTILSLGLLLLARDMKTRDLIITIIFLIVSIAVHNSHFLITTILLFIFTLSFLIQKFRKKLSDFYFSGKRLILTWVIVLFTFLMVCSVNLSLGGGFALSRAGQVFLLARIYDMGILKPYLDDNCGKYHFMICEYKDKLPYSILWDYNNSPLYKNGGWETPQKQEEYSAIVRDILTTPKYGHLFLVKATEAAFTQFFSFSLAEPIPQREDSPVYTAISVHYPASLWAMKYSHQWNDSLDFTFIFPFINEFQNFITGISLLFYMICFVYPLKFKRFNKVMLFIVAGTFINALICGALAGLSERYQCRVVWLLPLPLFLVLANKEFFLERFRKVFL